AATRRAHPEQLRRVLLGPGDDLARAVDDGAVVEHEGRHPAVARQFLHLAPPARGVQGFGQRREAVGLDQLGLVPGLLERLGRVAARMPARARRLERPPADVELHWTVSVPSMPAWRCPGTEQ